MNVTPSILGTWAVLAAAGCSTQTLIVGIVAGPDAGVERPVDAGASARDASTSAALRVQIALRPGQAADGSVALRCLGSCVDLVASASGGRGPYTFTWQSGERGAELHLCPEADTSLGVTVNAAGETASATLALRMLDCAPTEADSGIDVCRLGPDLVLPEQVTANVMGNSSDLVGLQFAPVVYYARGAALPAGRYRVQYVAGCFSCCVTLLDAFWLVGEDMNVRVLELPGGASSDVFEAPVARCPVSGAPFAPIDFDFGGGKLGVWLSDTVAGDNVNGDGNGGRSPTWRLSRIDCP